jgi:hypothetical protein
MFTPLLTPKVNTLSSLEDQGGSEGIHLLVYPLGITSPLGDKVHPIGQPSSQGPTLTLGQKLKTGLRIVQLSAINGKI